MADGTATKPRSPGREAPLQLEIVTITPELAQQWLDRGGTNRKITRRRIEAMTAAIQRGEWQLTGEAIKLDHEGRVRDGQNRLHAIVEAGIPVRSVVARGVSEAAFDVMDTGRSRTANVQRHRSRLRLERPAILLRTRIAQQQALMAKQVVRRARRPV